MADSQLCCKSQKVWKWEEWLGRRHRMSLRMTGASRCQPSTFLHFCTKGQVSEQGGNHEVCVGGWLNEVWASRP